MKKVVLTFWVNEEQQNLVEQFTEEKLSEDTFNGFVKDVLIDKYEALKEFHTK